ncbi:uncharacterized protein RSE6_14580 [Rhynchosporium secalis]|uniref:Uncharacterized protein n=1 Tax=Rhynchosporium secalis TaxID=38038 RepID=A0A1E1MVP8_RHYSE|nr:uncharacterized protein RSE6_14580 [Rhynchosporium secalis]
MNKTTNTSQTGVNAEGLTEPSQLQEIVNGFCNFLSVPTSFKITEVDGLTSPRPNIKGDANNDLEYSATLSVTAGHDLHSDPPQPRPDPGELNILAKLKGDFHGAGLNMIFRPSYGNIRRNNVLEYNVTEETTQFLEDIGDVHNRGLGRQPDIILKAVPYMQTVKDMLDADTGRADRADGGIPIHFESGMFLRTPPTVVRPGVPKGTISRLASIPHGTVINCQGFEPDMKTPKPGSPEIRPISVLPFPMGSPEDLVTFADFFPQLNFSRSYELRIPREIKSGGVLNEPLMLDPNRMLEEFNKNSTKKTIKEHHYFFIHSDPSVSGIPGGGTANIAFLAGSGELDGPNGRQQNPGPNANGVRVGCEYWISTVEYDVLLPEGDFSGDKKSKVILESEARKEEKAAGKIVVSPSFILELDMKIPPSKIVKLEATQIQYSQNVTLDFDEMGWPHISVATLSPLHPVQVPDFKLIL